LQDILSASLQNAKKWINNNNNNNNNIAAQTPEIYRLVHAAYSCEPILAFGEHQVLSEEGAQQGVPLAFGSLGRI